MGKGNRVMNEVQCRYVKIHPDAPDLTRAHPNDAGVDLHLAEDVTIAPNGHIQVGTGIAIQVPPGHMGMVFVRSSTGIKRHVVLSNGTGIIDADYTGEIILSLHNTGDTFTHFNQWDKVAQLVIVKIGKSSPIRVSKLTDTARGTNGIGSTGQ